MTKDMIFQNRSRENNIFSASSLAMIAFTALGIASFRFSAWSIFRIATPSSLDEFYLPSITAQAIVVICCIFFIKQLSDKPFIKVLFVLSASLMSISTLFVFNVLDLSFLNEQLVRLFASVIHGGTSALLLLGWGVFVCSISPTRSALSISLAYVIYGFATSLLSSAGETIFSLTALLAPLLSVIFLLRCRKKLGVLPQELSLAKVDFTSLPWGLFFLLLLCSFTSSLMGGLIESETQAYLTMRNIFWPIVYSVIFAVFVLWLVVLKKDAPERLWPLMVLFVFGGLLIFSALGTRGTDVASSFMMATQNCIILFFWVFIADIVYTRNLPKLFFFGIGNLVFGQGHVLVSALCELSLGPLPEETKNIIAVVFAIGMAFILVAFSFILFSKKSLQNNTLEPPSPVSENSNEITFSALSETIAQEHALTPRETEVLEFLLRGYTLPQIGKELFISLDTVRSHSKSIYRKLGIHKKQDLVKMAHEKYS